MLTKVDLDSPTAVMPAALVAGKYRLTRLLGRGGMGSVWEGIHTTLGTRVAVKFIDAEHAESPEARRRFENEARAAATLRSKHVVEVYDHGLMEDGRPFIVMEFLEGEPLDKRLDRVGRLPARDVARITSMVCRALSKAHAAGIVHRDLKPDNVFLVWDDEDGSDVAKVVDFGIAKFTESQVPASATRTGSVLGTPYYMSPEQARGLRSVDYRSDLWSVGVITYRCMTGHLPFEGEAVGDVLVKLCTAPLPVPSQVIKDVPPGFDAWFERALSREPERRFQTASELATSLAAVCGLSVQTSLAGGDLSGSSPQIHVPIAPAMTPFSATTPSANPIRGPQITGAPITQTPAPRMAKPNRTGFLVGGIGLLLVLGIGVGVLVRAMGSAETGVHTGTSTPNAEPVVAPQKQPEPTVAKTSAPVIPPPETAIASPAPPSAHPAPLAAPVAAKTLPKRAPRPTAKPKGKPTGPKPAEDIGF
jgi:serine/threonine-protein kinase